MKYIIASLVSIVLCAQVAPAQLTWERLPAPDGTWSIKCLSVDPATGDLYAGTINGGGIYVSTDNGVTWNPRSNGLPVNKSVTDIAIAAGAAYATADKIYKSTDAGGSWTEVAGSPGGMTNIHATSGGTLFAGSEITSGGQGIYKSTDAGATWTLSSSGIPSYVIFYTYYRSVSAITSDASGNLYCSVNSGNATTEAGVYASTDGGANWTRTSTGLLAHVQVEAVKWSPEGKLYVGVRNRFYSSTDNGASWTQGDSIPMASTNYFHSIAVNAANDVFVATLSGLYRGGSGGTGWTRIGESTLPTIVEDVAVGTASGTVLAGGLDVLGTGGGCFRSTDNGGAWAPSNSGMNNGLVLGLGVTPSGSIFSGMAGGRVDYSTDGGATFTRVYLPYTGIFALATITTFRGNANDAVVAGAAEGTFTSTDGGATWAKTGSTATRSFASDPDQNFYAATGAGVSKSTDDGLTWTGMGGGGDSYSVFHTSSGTILSGTYNAGINRTSDGGANWTNSGTGSFGAVTIGRFVQLDNGTIYVHTLGGLHRSTDDGVSWSPVTGTPLGEQLRTLAAAGGTLFLGTPGGLYRSTDGAATWEPHSTGLLWTILDFLAVGPDGRLLGSGGTGIYRTIQTVATSVEMTSAAVPSGFSLRQNYPNPFNPSTSVEFSVPVESDVKIAVYDALGRTVAVLAEGPFEPGSYRVAWEAGRAASGVYFCAISAGPRDGSAAFTDTRRMLLIR
jgi:hypothetical protein